MAEDGADQAVPPPMAMPTLEHPSTVHDVSNNVGGNVGNNMGNNVASRKSTLEVSMFDINGSRSTAASTIGYGTHKASHHAVEFDEYFVSLGP